jgi:MFS transporter, OFA family, oxalate/formate antiporter
MKRSTYMPQKKTMNFGFRGWMLIIYQAIAFLSFLVFTNYPMNVLADMYGGAQKLSMIYTISLVIGIIAQLILARFVGKIKNVKRVSIILGFVSLLLALGVVLISPAAQVLWQLCYGLEVFFVVLYSTFSIGILVGQWFPRRKGTVMGIATFAFPIANGLLGLFAGTVFHGQVPNVFGAFLPYLILSAVGLLIGAFLVTDYPEQCGAFRDNDKSITPEVAKAMMEAEIKAKATSVWTVGHTLKSRDFWFITIPMGLLLFCAVGLMTQSMSIIGNFSAELEPVGGFGIVMLGVAVVACFGSWLLGVLDTKFGTKFAITVSVAIMVVGGFVGAIHNFACLLIAMFCVAIFMGASSNFTVSSAAQYWRREDFPSVFACVNPIANVIQAIGPMVIAILLTTQGYQAAFIAVGVLGVLSVVFILLFSSKNVKLVDDKYRKAAGLALDDSLLSRK